jgi:hypothetical protein
MYNIIHFLFILIQSFFLNVPEYMYFKIYKQNIFHTVNKIMNLDVPGKWAVMYLCVRRHVFVC